MLRTIFEYVSKAANTLTALPRILTPPHLWASYLHFIQNESEKPSHVPSSANLNEIYTIYIVIRNTYGNKKILGIIAQEIPQNFMK